MAKSKWMKSKSRSKTEKPPNQEVFTPKAEKRKPPQKPLLQPKVGLPTVIGRKDIPHNDKIEEVTFNRHVWTKKLNNLGKPVYDPKTEYLWYVCSVCELESLDPEKDESKNCTVTRPKE